LEAGKRWPRGVCLKVLDVPQYLVTLPPQRRDSFVVKSWMVARALVKVRNLQDLLYVGVSVSPASRVVKDLRAGPKLDGVRADFVATLRELAGEYGRISVVGRDTLLVLPDCERFKPPCLPCSFGDDARGRLTGMLVEQGCKVKRLEPKSVS
jgi:hypothetical protein